MIIKQTTKRFLIWFLAAAVFQLAFYAYLDRILLAPAASFTQQSVTEESNSGSSIIYSFDESYYSELSPQGIRIFSSSDKKLVEEVKLNSNELISYFTWLPTRNLALVGICQETNKASSVALKAINPETGSKPVEPQIGSLAKGSKIVDIAYSEETNVIYMLIKNNNSSLIYRADANNKVTQIKLNTTNINRIACLNNQDALLYDSPTMGKVYIIDQRGVKKEVLPASSNYALLGVDKADNIFVGKLGSQQKVSSIVVGKANSSFTEFRKLDSQYPSSSLKITYDGKLLFI